MDTFANPKSVFLSRALRRVGTICAAIEQKEKSYSFFRLIFTVCMIGFIFSKWSQLEFHQKIFTTFAFICVTLLLIKIHNTLKKKINRSQSYKKSYEHSLARAERQWDALEALDTGLPKTADQHPYALDLDLHTHVPRWLCTCLLPTSNVTLMERLAQGGITPPPVEERAAQARRSAYLSQHTLLLRRLDAKRFAQSAGPGRVAPATGEPTPPTTRLVYVACVVVCLAWAGLLLPAYAHFINTQDAEAFFHALMLFLPFPLLGALWLKPWTSYGAQWSREVRSALPLLEAVMGLPPQAVPTDLRDAHKAFSILRRIHFILNALEVRANPLLWGVLHAALPYDGLLGIALSRAVRVLEAQWPQWRVGLASFDMDCAFARAVTEDQGMAFFPHAPASGTPARLRVEHMGHPLIPFGRRVLNSLELTGEHPARLLTGSNMSGKSTFLRSLGLNCVLYNVGGPVCAQAMDAPPCLVLCAIRVEDSLSNATSYFYAEVKRLASILKALSHGSRPQALYLVDEIFKGTNNKERIWGSSFVIQALLESGAFGMVSTHDLALAQLEAKDGRILNCHFKESVEGGALVFDYTLRAGPCPTTNALHIMRQEGLPVPEHIPETFSLS